MPDYTNLPLMRQLIILGDVTSPSDPLFCTCTAAVTGTCLDVEVR